MAESLDPKSLFSALQLIAVAIGKFRPQEVPLDSYIRGALQELHFSKITIEHIEGIAENIEESKLRYHIGQVATSQGYSRISVLSSINSIREIRNDKRVSTGVNRILQEIVYDKIKLRKHIAELLFSALKKTDEEREDCERSYRRG